MIKLFNEIKTLTDKLVRDASELSYQSKEAVYDTNREYQFEYLSNCCGVEGNEDLGFCADCKEHCTYTNEDGFTRDEMKNKVVDKNGNILTDTEVEEKRLLAECIN